MIYSMDLYYNSSMLEPLGYEWRTKMNGNVLKAILFFYVPEVFLTFIALL
jgi:hypothetical protein